MTARWAAADLLAAPIASVRDNRRLVAEAAGLPVIPRDHASTVPLINGTTETRNDGSTVADRAEVKRALIAALGEWRGGPRLEGEDATQSDLVWLFDQGVHADRWLIAAVAIHNEVRIRSASQAELRRDPGLLPWHERQVRGARIEGGRTRLMGRRKGAPDLLLIDADPGNVGQRFGLLEVKSATGRLEPEQRLWRNLAELAGWHWGLARTPGHREDALRAVRAWGWVP